MALYFKTDSPQKLLDEFKKAIKEGKIATWMPDKDGDFTHTPEQWKNRAWLRPKIESGKLALYVLRPKGTNITSLPRVALRKHALSATVFQISRI